MRKKAIAVFLIFFCLLVYFCFPYNSLKNYIESAIRVGLIENGSTLNVKIKTVKPYWFTGIELKDVSINSAYENERYPLEIKKITARLSFLPLLIGRANFNTNIFLAECNTHVFFSLPLFALFNQDIKKFEVKTTFNHFDIGASVDQYLATLENLNNPNLSLFKPILSVTSLGGYLNGTVYIKANNNTQNGVINLNIEKAYLDVADKNLHIPAQHFKQAKIDLTWDGNTYKIGDNMAFASENIYFKPKGNFQQIPVGQGTATMLNIDFLLILSGSIEKNFGFLIPQLLKCPSNSFVEGVMNVKLVGPFPQYICQ